MHTFGFPCAILELAEICEEWGIILIEDAAESLGSYVGNQHTGTFGAVGAFSFNGNKVITTGGGGMLVTNNSEIASRAKHLTTTSKVPHPFEFEHDSIGYNYRMPNLNAALGCAQMEGLKDQLLSKYRVSRKWQKFFESYPVDFVVAAEGCKANFWLNAIILKSEKERDEFLEYTNAAGVLTRPIWKLMTSLKMFRDCQSDDLKASVWLSQRVVNIPSSALNPLVSE
tara:strand:- start:53 stop:733 length:681 start_codon:yes stop_codon:yes gene_type:complete